MLVLAIAFATGTIKLRYFATDQPSPYGLNPMDERTDETWQLEDGSSAHIARTYFTAADDAATFHVEWEVPVDRLPSQPTREAKLDLVRPVLRYAFGRGEMVRTKIFSPGVGPVLVRRLMAEVRGSGTERKVEVVVSNMDELLIWNWTFNGRLHRISGPGYYVDEHTGRVTFTMKWHDRTLCDSLERIDDNAAFVLAEPVLRQAAAWRLWRTVPLASPKGIFPPRESVDEVGLELGCPEENCAAGTPCGVRGYRVSRPVEVLRAPQE